MSLSSKQIKHLFLHESEDEDEFCMGACFAKYFKKHHSEMNSHLMYWRYFQDLPYLNVGCTVQWMYSAWRNISENSPNPDPNKRIPLGIERWIEFGMLESLVKLLEFHISLFKSDDPKDHQFLQDNQNVNHCYYAMYMLSCIPMSIPRFVEKLFPLLHRIKSVVMDCLNLKCTWLEARCASRLCQFIVFQNDIKYRKEFFDVFFTQDIFNRMIYFAEYGYEIMYRRFYQFHEQRLGYQVDMISRSTTGDPWRQDEDQLENQTWQYAFGWVRWCSTYICNVLNNDAYDSVGNLAIPKLEKGGFYKRVLEILKSSQCDDVSNMMIDSLISTVVKKIGRRIISSKYPQIMSFMAELVNSTEIFEACCFFLPFLEDVDFVEIGLKHALPYIPFAINCPYVIDSPAFIDKYKGKTCGESVALAILQQEKILRKNEKFNDILDICKSSLTMIRKRKQFESVFASVFAGPDRKVLNYDLLQNNSIIKRYMAVHAAETGRVESGEITSIHSIISRYNMVEFCARRIKRMKAKSQMKEKIFLLNYTLSSSDGSPYLHWERFKSSYFKKKHPFIKLATLCRILGQSEAENKTIPNNENKNFIKSQLNPPGPYDDYHSFKTLVDKMKFRMREGRFFKKYGPPTYHPKFFLKNFKKSKEFSSVERKPFNDEELIWLKKKKIDDMNESFKYEIEKKRECRVCKKSKEKLYKCSKCRNVFYCSALCQKKDWKKHSKECFDGR